MDSTAMNQDVATRGRDSRGGAPVREMGDASKGWAGAREVPAWAVSLAVHVVILLFLGSLTEVTLRDSGNAEITSVYEQLDEEEFKFEDATVVDQIGSEGESDRLSAMRNEATRLANTQPEQIQKQLEEEIIKVDAPPQVEIAQPNTSDLIRNVDIMGQASEHTGGVEGAVDRLTYEIQGSLKENKTLVVWLFDESGSMTERRNAIADRFENVYRQLRLLKADKGEALKTAVVGFSDKTTFYTPDPVDDIEDAAEKVRNIKRASSPREHVFTAVEEVTKKWLYFRTRQRRNFMIIIVTDERGDDYQRLEEVIHLVSRYGIRCYCVGNAAVFGREKGYIRWTYEDGYQEDLPVDQGPETVASERLQLPFWGVRGNDLEQMSAGIGPYALTRLCAESKGMYLIAADANGPKFDPEVMRNYLPDYRPIREYQQDLQTNLAKGALVKVAMTTNDATKRAPRPQLRFRADSDTTLRREVTEAQKPLARFDYHLDEMLSVLVLGEKDRPKLTTPRWQASFDLAMGRLLAMRVRSFGYNVVLAQMKAAPKTFRDKKNNTWELVPAPEVDAGPQVKKMSQKATEYLTRVIDEHPGTPWAMLAERELSSPMGWKWKEAYRNYDQNGGSGRNPNVIELEVTDPKTGKKKKVTKKRERPAL